MITAVMYQALRAVWQKKSLWWLGLPLLMVPVKAGSFLRIGFLGRNDSFLKQIIVSIGESQLFSPSAWRDFFLTSPTGLPGRLLLIWCLLLLLVIGLWWFMAWAQAVLVSRFFARPGVSVNWKTLLHILGANAVSLGGFSALARLSALAAMVPDFIGLPIFILFIASGFWLSVATVAAVVGIVRRGLPVWSAWREASVRVCAGWWPSLKLASVLAVLYVIINLVAAILADLTTWLLLILSGSAALLQISSLAAPNPWLIFGPTFILTLIADVFVTLWFWAAVMNWLTPD